MDFSYGDINKKSRDIEINYCEILLQNSYNRKFV